MQVLVCAGDGMEVNRFREAVEEILDDESIRLDFDGSRDVFAARTQRGLKSENRIYLLSGFREEAASNARRLEELKAKLIRMLDLDQSQVVVASTFR